MNLSARLFGVAGRLLGWRWYPLVLAVVAGALAVAVKHLVYPDLSWNRDEPVYLWQAGLLRDGQLTSTDGGYPALFQPWLSAHHDGRFFTQYPLVWPAAIVAGRLVGWPNLTLVVASALAVVGTYAFAREVTGRTRTAGLAATLLLASPIVAVQSGVYLTYLFALGLGTLFAAALLGAARTGSRRQAAVAGLLLGVILATRTYDAVVWAAAIGGFVVVTERRRWRALLRLAPAFLATLVPVVALQLLHNWWTTGSPTQFAISVADPLDRFGFGDRRLMPRLDTFDYTPGRAVVGTAKHLFFLPWFVFGTYLGAAVALFGAWRERASRSTGLLLTVCAAFPLAYFPFWGIHISSLTTRISGPIYYIPVYAPVCVLMAVGLVQAARRHQGATALVVAASMLITVPVTIGRLGLNRQLGRLQTAWTHTTDAVPGRALVVVSPSPYLLFLPPEGSTRPDQEQRLVFATDVDPSLIDLVDRSDRPAYLVRASVPASELAPSEHTSPYRISAVPLELVRGRSLVLDITAVSPRAGSSIIDVSVADEVVWSAPTTAVTAGTRRSVRVRVGHDRASAGPDGIVVPDGATTLEVTMGVGADADAVRTEPSVKYRILVSSGTTTRALQPGRFYRPDNVALADGDLRWRDDVDRGDLLVDVTGEPAPGN